MINNYGCVPNDETTCNVGPGQGREPIAAIDKSVKVAAWITPQGGN